MSQGETGYVEDAQDAGSNNGPFLSPTPFPLNGSFNTSSDSQPLSDSSQLDYAATSYLPQYLSPDSPYQFSNEWAWSDIRGQGSMPQPGPPDGSYQPWMIPEDMAAKTSIQDNNDVSSQISTTGFGVRNELAQNTMVTSPPDLHNHGGNNMSDFEGTVSSFSSNAPNTDFQCPECQATFSGRPNLMRHQREVHKISHTYKSPPSYACPIESCTRSTKPFPRKYNLMEHMRKRHARLLVRTPKAAAFSPVSKVNSPIANHLSVESPQLPLTLVSENGHNVEQILEGQIIHYKRQKLALEKEIGRLQTALAAYRTHNTNPI